MNVVIAGAGQAAASGAAKLRAMGCTDPITIIGQEPVAPYQRPPLSKAYLLGDMALDRLLLRKNDWWADHDITLRLGEKVLHIDRRARQVTTTRDRIEYETLILALGAEPLRLPDSMGGALAGVHYIRNLADIDHLAPALRPDRNLVVIGGGYIGLEAAAVARKLGLNVTLVEAAPRILSRVAAARTADLIRDLHHAHGVKLIEGVAIMKLIGTDRVRGVALSDGRQIAADLVICGIGARPETALAKTAGLAVDNGIVADMFGRTDDPRIWAAGDCASMSGPDGLLRLESVGNAIDMAEAVAANIMGGRHALSAKTVVLVRSIRCQVADCRTQPRS